MPERYVDRKEAAEYLTAAGTPVARATLAKYATLGGGPEYRLFGRKPLYAVSALDAWIESKLSPPLRSSSDLPRPNRKGAA